MSASLPSQKRPGKRLVVFRHLNLFRLPIAYAMRLAGWRVIFIEPVGTIRTLVWMERLGKAGIEWVDYASYQGYRTHADMNLASDYAEEIIERAFSAGDFELLFKLSPAFEGDLQKGRSFLFTFIEKAVSPFSEAYALAEYFVGQGYRSYIYQPRMEISVLIGHLGITAVRNVCPFRGSSGISVKRIAKSLTSRVGRMLRRTQASGEKMQAKASPRKAKPAGPSDVLCFLHRGPSYGRLYKKDLYYAEDPSSPLHRDNIIHCELGWMMSAAQHSDVVNDYAANDLNLTIVDAPRQSGLSRAGVVLRAIFGCMKGPNTLARGLLLGRAALQVNAALAALASLPKVKVALIVYIYLFPKAAIIALQHLGIKVIAVQERFISAFYKTQAPLADVLCVHGEVVAKQFAKHPYASIGSVVVTGDVQASVIGEYAEEAQRERQTAYGQYKTICVVLDYHSMLGPFENAIYFGLDWKNNALFYETIHNLATKNPDCLFIVRGKNAKWLDNPAMAGSVALLARTENIIVDQTYDRSNFTYFLAAMADVVVARYTSMCDQCMAAGIPVLIYEWLSNGVYMIEERFDYKPYPVLVHDEEELMRRFEDTVRGDGLMTDEAFQTMRRDFYDVSPDGSGPSAKEKLHQEILSHLSAR